MFFPDEAKVWAGLLWCLQHAPMGLQSAELVHSQTAENKDSVGLGSSATTVFLYKSVPIGQTPLLIWSSRCIPANRTKARICMHMISQATSLLVFIIISYCMNFFSQQFHYQPQAGFLVFTKAGSLRSVLTFTDIDSESSAWSHEEQSRGPGRTRTIWTPRCCPLISDAVSPRSIDPQPTEEYQSLTIFKASRSACFHHPAVDI